jgi:transcriptional regulator with XRE-family HTH domain
MPTINPRNLRILREKRGWNLDDLASRSKVDRGTISRIETGKQTDNRRTTVERLSSALDVESETLTGPDVLAAGKEVEPTPKSQMNIRMANDARNALALVASRYQVKPPHILHLAPLLFLWAAEESLKRRQQKLDAYTAQLSTVEKQFHFGHLNADITDNERGWVVVDEEHRSIARRDIFGVSIEDHAVRYGYEDSEQNPMALFLNELVAPLNGLAQFEHWSPNWGSPGYTLGREEASLLVGGDEQATNHIVNGYAPLHELPKEVREAGPQEIARWARERGDTELAEMIGLDEETVAMLRETDR